MTTAIYFWAKSPAQRRALERLGWRVAPQRSSHHHFYALLMIWRGRGEPVT
jgi:hypothetical protein